MDKTTVDSLAKTVDEAARTATSITMLTATHDITLEDAYVIQRASIARRIDRGETRAGMKMGLTSLAKMQQMGVHNPIYGHLTNTMRKATGDTISASAHIHPRVEPEVAFVLGEDLVGPTTPEEAANAIDKVYAALEVIDSRYTDFKFTLIDVVADNASSTRFALGEISVSPDEVDLGNLGMVLKLNGEVKETGSSAAILEHPLRSLAALANMLAEVGEQLYAGDVVLAGGATKAIHVSEGDHVSVDVEVLGRVELFIGE